MMPAIIYPLPFDQWAEFERYVDRFTRTFKEYPPAANYEVWAVCNWGEPTDHVREFFYGIKTRFIPYYNHGCDIGSAQHVASALSPETLMICMTSRCYFHRAGWLQRYVEAYERHGDALYGATASWESGTPHIRTAAYALRASTFSKYPNRIDAREKGIRFECGDWCVSKWCRQMGLGLWQVTWDGEQEQDGWRSPANVYRKGNQSNCLVFDKYTDAYADKADHPSEQERLARMANPT